MPTYTLVTFFYSPANGATLVATINQTISGATWSLNKTITGAPATTIWDARGETEDQLIARILAA